MTTSASDILAPDGAVSRRLGDSFEARNEQRSMAAAVERAMASTSHLVVEAGTGVGKSFAYLVPAALRAIEHGEVVVICTNTIALQEQLVNKDIPLLLDALDPGVDDAGRPRLRPVLVKGRGNYVSIRRLTMASSRQDKLFADPAARRSLHVIEDWAYSTRDGTLSSIPPVERMSIWDAVRSDSGNCMGRRCPTYESCFYQRARREMDAGNLLICNHALFFSDLALRQDGVGFLPDYRHVVLDEAHAIEDTAAEHFGRALTEYRVTHLLSALVSNNLKRGYLLQLELLHPNHEAVTRAVTLVSEVADAARQFFEDLLACMKRLGNGERDAPVFSRSAPRPGARGVRLRHPEPFQDSLSEPMSRLALTLATLRDSCEGEPDRFELNAYATRAREIADDAAALVQQSLPGCAYWAEIFRRDDEGNEKSTVRPSLACAPIDIAPILKKALFGTETSVILTSATLSTRRVRDDETPEASELAFAHTLDRLGCDGARTLQLGSPFDYATQARLIVDELVPPQDDPTYHDRLAARTVHYVRDSLGGAFVLFTSFASLNAVAARIRPQLEPDGFLILAQGADGSRSEILARFRGHPKAVLLGAASFWQGVDVQGQSLRNVLITKLPFEPPDHPLTQARLERVAERGGDPFKDDSLPRAILRFKQGFGRLIRSKSDRGSVVVLDGRVSKSWYGKKFLESLPLGLPVERRKA